MPKKKNTDRKLPKVSPKPSNEDQVEVNLQDNKAIAFPVIGLGASAGGLEALKLFFSAVPENSPMAYIVVVHMAPNQPSMMPELLQRTTPLSVSSAKDGQIIEPGHIYIIPPNKEITLYKGEIQLLDMLEKRVSHPIDIFLRSLAQDQGKQAAAVILSGTGTFRGYSPTEKNKPRWWDVIVTPLFNTNGKIEQLLAVSRDITKQKMMEDEFLQAQKMESIIWSKKQMSGKGDQRKSHPGQVKENHLMTNCSINKRNTDDPR